MAVIEIKRLRKDYRGRRGQVIQALDELDLSVPAGGVFAFLGPNGAGKSTTLRCVLGLVRPTSGDIRVLGARVPQDLFSAIHRIGSVLETPAFHPRFSGRQNLTLLGRLGAVSRRAVEESLERLGLTARADDRVETYSLGMRQRLGLAAALLKDPAVVLLDEPTNGLDPGGIAEMRDILRGLAHEGRTVLVSSHLLTEVSLIANHVAIISRGRAVYAGRMDDLLKAHDPGNLIVRVEDVKSAAAVLSAAGFEVMEENGDLRVAGAASRVTEVGRQLAARDLYPLELRVEAAALEDVFLKLTAKDAGPLR
jgi:ABC-2 type transport system ATP-binding protein